LIDKSDLVLRELKWIRWLLLLIATSFALVAVSLTYLSYSIDASSASDASFSSQVSELREQGKFDELIEYANARQKTHPEDPNVYWHRGYANYRLKRYQAALVDFERTAQIEPTWKSSHTDEYVALIKDAIK
jgi:tetratricopeptide (TPR) repeat protein